MVRKHTQIPSHYPPNTTIKSNKCTNRIHVAQNYDNLSVTFVHNLLLNPKMRIYAQFIDITD